MGVGRIRDGRDGDTFFEKLGRELFSNCRTVMGRLWDGRDGVGR